MSTPKVSVVMCVYNGQRWLREALDSVLAQTFSDFELIVVDDGSTDATPTILASCRDPRVRVIRQSNQGLAAARNTGAMAARASFVAYLDADDACEPDRLRVQHAALTADPALAAVGCSVRIIDETGRLLFIQQAPVGAARCRTRLFNSRFYNYGSSLMIRREALVAVGLFRTFFVQREDVDFMLRLAERFAIDNVRDVLYRYRINTAGLSHQDIRVGLHYHEVAYALHRERLSGTLDQLQRGQSPPAYVRSTDVPARPNSVRKVVTYLHLGEAELLRETGQNWAAAGHVLRACWNSPFSRSVLSEGLRILATRPPPAETCAGHTARSATGATDPLIEPQIS